MKIEEELIKIKPEKGTVFTIGVFDGVHLGHQHLLNFLKDTAKKNDWLSGVLTFKSHPQTLLSSDTGLIWLSDLDKRINLLQDMGIDIIIALDFTPEIRQLSAQQFMQLLKTHLKLRGLIIGPDFTLGKDKRGTADYLRSLGQEMDFTVEVVSPIMLDGEIVSSSKIRHALVQGDVQKVSKLLGRFFSLSGRIVPGDQRGRNLGFPTINLDLNLDQASPGNGVYATFAFIENQPLPSVTNIGTRPTFEGDGRLAETFIIDYKSQMLKQKLRIEFIEKLRNEIKFANADELKSQIEKDVEQAKEILIKHRVKEVAI